MDKLSSYFIKSYRAPRSLFKYFKVLIQELSIPGEKEETKALRKKYHRFVCHVYVCMRIKSIETDDELQSVKVPIPCELIWERLGRTFDMNLLLDNKLICRSGYKHYGTKGKGRCRVYWLPDKIFNHACSLQSTSIFDSWDKLLKTGTGYATVNLITGSSMSKCTSSKNLILNQKDDTLDKAPRLIKQSMSCLQPCVINPYPIIPWARKAEDKFKREQSKLDMCLKRLRKRFPDKKPSEIRKLKAYRKVEKQRNKARGLYNNIVTCLTTILNRSPVQAPGYNGKFWTYNAAYRLQKSGRVGEIHGGFQNICTPAKMLLLKDVDYYNYDIKSSQAVILAYELRRHDLRCEWLEKYNNNKSMRKQYAKQIGITEGCWKDAFYAIIMGAEAGDFGAPVKAIRREIKDIQQSQIVVKQFIQIIEDLLTKCDQWREKILHTTDRRYVKPYAGTYWWKNLCEKKFPDHAKDQDGNIIALKTGEIIESTKALKKLQRQLAAFFLQGTEAFIIHNLTVSCTRHGIPVYKNEHDGLIVGKEIPKHIFKDIVEEAGYPELEIADKDICDNTKFNHYNDYINN